MSEGWQQFSALVGLEDGGIIPWERQDVETDFFREESWAWCEQSELWVKVLDTQVGSLGYISR